MTDVTKQEYEKYYRTNYLISSTNDKRGKKREREKRRDNTLKTAKKNVNQI